MADQDTIQIQAIDGRVWTIPKDKLPDAQKRGAKIYTTPVQQAPQEDSAISRFGSGVKAGTQPLIPSNPFTVENLKNAAMGGPGMIYNLVNNALMEYHKSRNENQPPWAAALAAPAGAAGIDTEGVRQRGARGDIAGIVGEMIPGIAATVLLPEIPKVGVAAAEASRAPVRNVFGVGSAFEERIAAEHQNAVTDYIAKLSQIMEENRRAVNEARQTHEQAVANVQKQNAEARAEYQEKVNGIRQKYAQQVGAKEAGTPPASASQTAAETKRAALGESPRRGPVAQRLQAMTNQVYGMIDNLQDRVRSYNQRQWRAFDRAVDEAMKKKGADGAQVDWTPVQQAVKDAEENILKGSPESIAIFRNIMKEGPQLDEASVFRSSQATQAAQNLKDLLRSKQIGQKGFDRAMAQLHGQGVPIENIEVAPTNTITKGLRIPFADARGYFTELGGKLSGAQLPGDVYRALDHVRDVADQEITKVTKEARQDAVYRNLRNEYKTYKQDFDDPEAAIYQFDKLDTPEKRVNFLAGGKGQNLIDSLSKYRGFGAEPNLPGRVRSLVRQLRDLPEGKPIPASPERPSFPKEPEPKEFPTEQSLSLKKPPAAPEPLDITRKRVEQLENMAKSWSQFTPNQARWLRSGITQRAIGSLLSRPGVREWIAREGR